MVSAALSPGAGRTPTGNTPQFALDASITAGQRSALTRQPLYLPPQSTISNRNFQQLEIPVTHRKHSLGPKSNRNFRSTNFAWGSESSLRNFNTTTIRFARTRSTPSTNPLCPPVFSVSSVKCSTLLILYPRQPQISNRNWIGLEIAVTIRKQKEGIDSNRNKCSLVANQKPAKNYESEKSMSLGRRVNPRVLYAA
jgi:hypothetical protein